MTMLAYVDDVSHLPHTYVSVDLEGTGTFGSKNDIVELAVILVKDGKICDPKIWMFKPKHGITSRGTKIHGISNDDVRNCPYIEGHVEEIRQYLDEIPYVGHCVGTDISLLKNSLKDWKPKQIFDTYRIARKAYTNLPLGYKLKDLCTKFNLESEITAGTRRLFQQYPRQLSGFHTAGCDALACMTLIEHIRLDVRKDYNLVARQQKLML